MKKLSMICMAALLVMAMSCKKNENENNADGKGFRASMEAPTGDSKTHLENDGIVKWDAGDAIRVVNNATPAVCKKFTTDAEVDQDGCVEFKPSQDVDRSFFQPDYTAYYPASIYDHTTGNVTLPAEQSYVKKDNHDSFGNGCNPMVAKSADEQLSFKHLCGILALPLKGTCMVKSIKLTAKGGEQLCGVGTVGFSGDRPTFAFDVTSKTDGNNSITLTCGDGVQLNTTNATTFYFVIPAVTLSSGIDVKLTDTDNNVWERSASMVTSISQHKISKMAELSIETHNPNFPIGAIPGWFTINASGDKVCFSRGNLQYLAKGGLGGNATATANYGESVGGTWRFSEHQYDICSEAANVNASYESTEWIDHFAWGTSGFNHNNDNLAGSTNNNNDDRNNKDNCYQPWRKKTNVTGQSDNPNYYAYNIWDRNLGDESGKADWGRNTIYCGSTPTTGWRTLGGGGWGSSDNLYYIIHNRTTDASSLYGYGKIDGIYYGLILLPDGWSYPTGISESSTQAKDFKANNYANWNLNHYTIADWVLMENAGAVFFPCAGFFNGNSSLQTSNGSYFWTSSYSSTTNAVVFGFGTYPNGGFTNPNPGSGVHRTNRMLVRLVKDKQ